MFITRWKICDQVSLIIIVVAELEDYEGNVHLVFDGNDDFEGVMQVRIQLK